MLGNECNQGNAEIVGRSGITLQMSIKGNFGKVVIVY